MHGQATKYESSHFDDFTYKLNILVFHSKLTLYNINNNIHKNNLNFKLPLLRTLDNNLKNHPKYRKAED